MNELLDKILRLKTAAKIGVTVGLMLAVALIYNFMFFSDLDDEITTSRNQREQLTTEKASYEKRRAEFLAYKNELTRLQEDQREALRVLPKKAEIPAFIASLNEQSELSGVEIQLTKPEAEVAEDQYIKIPVKMEVSGTYHGITKFFKNVADLARIVNLENVNLLPERVVNNAEADTATTRVRLKAKFVAVTYRFQDQTAGAGGTTP